MSKVTRLKRNKMDYAKEAIDELWPDFSSFGMIAITKDGNIATILACNDGDFQPYTMVGGLEELKIALLQEIEGLL